MCMRGKAAHAHARRAGPLVAVSAPGSGPVGGVTATVCIRGCRTVSVVATDTVTFLIAVALAAGISTGVFVHATKHGSRHATAWGVAAFLAAGVAVPVYFIRYWVRRGGRD
jgi:hypothetical protein